MRFPRPRPKVELVGWIVVAVSLPLLFINLGRHKPSLAPEAESRKLPARTEATGAWWFMGNPPPAGITDLTGVWMDRTANLADAALPGQKMILTPLGQQRYDTVDHAKNPTNLCLPPGPVRILHMMLPMMIVQRPDVVLILSESQRTYRIVYTDGRGHDPDVKDYPEWMGSSIGHWEQDTLVVDTIAIHERSWLDISGHEHSGQLHMTEKFRLSDPNTIEYLATFDDPVFFVKPFTTRTLLRRQIGDRILDHSCEENEKDRENLVPTFGDAGR